MKSRDLRVGDTVRLLQAPHQDRFAVVWRLEDDFAALIVRGASRFPVNEDLTVVFPFYVPLESERESFAFSTVVQRYDEDGPEGEIRWPIKDSEFQAVCNLDGEHATIAVFRNSEGWSICFHYVQMLGILGGSDGPHDIFAQMTENQRVAFENELAQVDFFSLPYLNGQRELFEEDDVCHSISIKDKSRSHHVDR